MGFWCAVMSGFIFYFLCKLPSIVKFYKKIKEDEFLKSIDYNTRIPEVKSKPTTGKRRTTDQIRNDTDAYQKLLGVDFRKKAKATQIQAERVGSKGYIWRGDDCCPSCNKQNGKRYYWSKPPKTGHPGEGELCPNGYCRCWAEVIIPPAKK